MNDSKSNPTTIHIRWMVRSDIAQIVEIENAVSEYPWTKENFMSCLRIRRYIGMSVEHNERIVGYVNYHLDGQRIRIINLAVHPDYQRGGIGQQVIAMLIKKLSVKHRDRITLRIHETNLPAQSFFKSQGFIATAILRGSYDTNEDAYLFEFNCRQKNLIEPGNRIKRC